MNQSNQLVIALYYDALGDQSHVFELVLNLFRMDILSFREICSI